MLPASGFDRGPLLAVAVRLVHHPALTTAGDGTRCDVTSTRTLAEALAEIIAMNAPLGERLAAYAEALREAESPFAEEYDRLVERVRRGLVGADAPEPGDVMPPFLLPDSSGRMVGLDELLAEGPLVVSFNRGHWCPFCKIELTALADARHDFDELGARTISVMPERQPFTGPLQASLGDRVLILTDMDNEYALLLGLVIWVGDAIRDLMIGWGPRLDEFQGNDTWFLPLPATFVVGRDGRVRARYVDADFRTRMEIADIVRALRSQ
jgi:peroxiredoxin